jgi:hypothetical protein
MFSYWWFVPPAVIAVVAVLFIRGATRDITDEEKDADCQTVHAAD